MKPKNRTKYPEQKRLLCLIYRKLGGLHEVAAKLSISPQLAFFWREQGYVPLMRLERAAKTLKLSPYALNYKGYKQFKGDKTEWKDVLEKCKLTKAETDFVLGV